MAEIKIKFKDGRAISAVLDRGAAPLSVDNFVKLAKRGYYDGLCFHRVIEGFMIQGGGFVHENGRLKPAPRTSSIKGEFAANGVSNSIRHTAGTLSMARTPDPNSASSQFFICVADCAYLDGQYAAFGHVAGPDDLKVAVDISRVKTGNVDYYSDVPVEPVVIETITVEKDDEE